MSDDPVFKMYEAQAELVETRQELERIRRENDELKNERAVNHLMKTVDDFQRSNSNRFEAIEESLRMLTTTVSNNNHTFTEIKETLKDLKEKIQVQQENEKSRVDHHAKLSETVGAIQINFNALSTKVFSNDKVLLKINKTLRKQNDTLEKQNKDIKFLKKNTEKMEKENILLIGGWNGSKVVDSLLILQYNGENDGNWKELNIKLPYAVWCHGAQFLNNYLYIFGGENEKKEVLNSTYKLSISSKWYMLSNSLQWEKIADMNEKCTTISNSSVILNDQIWVIGGYNGRKKSLKSVEMYDPQTNIWKNMKEMNECRNLAAVAVVNTRIFCCGGRNGNKYLKSAECYDLSSNVWTLISDMPGPNAACGVVVMDTHLIVIGGRANDKDIFLNGVWILDTTEKNGKWIEKEPHLPRPLGNFSIAKIHDKIIVCGGLYIDKEDSNHYVTDDVEIFDVQVCRKGPQLTTRLRDAAAVVIPVEYTKFLN